MVCTSVSGFIIGVVQMSVIDMFYTWKGVSFLCKCVHFGVRNYVVYYDTLFSKHNCI